MIRHIVWNSQLAGRTPLGYMQGAGALQGEGIEPSTTKLQAQRSNLSAGLHPCLHL